MNYAVIDLGSNTVKLCVYQVEHSAFIQIDSKTEYTSTLQYIHHGVFSSEGIECLRKVLFDFQETAQKYGCSAQKRNLFCFSTASLRFINNRKSVIKEINNTNCIEIEPLSGEEEATCNYKSMKKAVGLNDFTGLDLGGGSMQIFTSERGKLMLFESFPLGGLRLYQEFVSGRFPDGQEAEAITGHVLSLLEKSRFEEDLSMDTLYLMGGTMRLAAAILEKKDFTRKELTALTKRFLADHRLAEREITAVMPKRVRTAVPGMLAVCAVMRYFSAEKAFHTDNSVREGYLMGKITGK